MSDRVVLSGPLRHGRSWRNARHEREVLLADSARSPHRYSHGDRRSRNTHRRSRRRERDSPDREPHSVANRRASRGTRSSEHPRCSECGRRDAIVFSRGVCEKLGGEHCSPIRPECFSTRPSWRSTAPRQGDLPRQVEARQRGDGLRTRGRTPHMCWNVEALCRNLGELG